MSSFEDAQKAYDNACDPRLEDNSENYAPCDICGDFYEHADLTAKWILNKETKEVEGMIVCPDCKEETK